MNYVIKIFIYFFTHALFIWTHAPTFLTLPMQFCNGKFDSTKIFLFLFSAGDLETAVDVILSNNTDNRRWLRKIYRDSYLQVSDDNSLVVITLKS